MEPGDKRAEIAERPPGRSAERRETRHAAAKSGAVLLLKGGRSLRFTDEERNIVTDARRELGNKWAEIAERLPGRSMKEVRKHWHNRLYRQRERMCAQRQEEAGVAKSQGNREEERQKEGPLSEEEKRIATDAQKELGNKWTEIAERLPGRSERQVNKWWHKRPCVQRERKGGL